MLRLLKPCYSTREVAAALGIHASTVRRWIEAGKLPGSMDLGGSAGYLVPRRALRSFLRAHRSASSAATTAGR